MMVSSIRSISTALPRISMARIPLVAFTNTHVSPAVTASQTQSHAHATSAHPSAYSSMPSSRNSNSNKYTNAADKLEKSAKGLSEAAKEYIREVKQYDSEEDEVLMELGLAMSTKSIKHSNGANKNDNMHTGNQSGGRRALIHDIKTEGNTFMESLSSDIQAEVTHPAGKAFHHADQHHQQEFISSLCEELKELSPEISSSRLSQHASDANRLSQHASDAIRMVESHSVLKQDKAPVHDVSDEDPTEKPARYQKRY